MPDSRIPLDRVTGTRFVRAVRLFVGSEVGGKAKVLFGLLFVFLLAISGLNVLNSYVGRDFMTAIEQRYMAGFVREALLYIGVFAASTVVAVIYRFTEERLGLLWREWLTRRLIGSYLVYPTYYRLTDQVSDNGEIANPDQRIAEDVRAFTATTISFVLLLANGTLTALAFSGVLWSISPLLFGVAVGYAALGSTLTILFGRPLVWLNYNQSDQEANLRAELVHVRENAGSLVLLGYEPHLHQRLMHLVDGVVRNFRHIISVNRNLGFFTIGYNYLIQIIPALIVAPMFIRGEAPFGVITQAAIAFTQLLGAFSLIVTQFQSISSFAAVVARLGSLAEAIERAQAVTLLSQRQLCEHGISLVDCPICLAKAVNLPALPTITLGDEEGHIVYDALTLRLPPDDRIGVRELSIEIPAGKRTLVLGPDEQVKVALIWATIGVWDAGAGRITRPPAGRLMVLPERPYIPNGTLRAVLALLPPAGPPSDEQVSRVLGAVNMEHVSERAGGLDTEQDWRSLLSLGELQLISAARVLLAAPTFTFLHRIGTTLGPEQVDQLLAALSERGITYVAFEPGDRLRDRADAVLVLAPDGSWSWPG